MDMFDGFVFLEEKKKSLIPILCQYDFLSALTAAFSITSWRKNRGAQESCLALNSAMVENTEWGRKTIFTPNDLEEFFQLLYPILKTTPYDDPVLPDFGEIKLNYRSKYYSVITGTGHTAPIFSALQFLEKISESACMDAYTDSLLCYSDYCIDFLKAKNTPINEDFSLHPQFESPTFDYYENVKDFMTEEKWTGLGTPLLSMLAAESNEIVRSHFFSFNDHYYPLFNPSLVIDDEAPFPISVRKGASSVLSGSLFSCLTSCKRARTAAFYARSRFYLNSGAVQISSGRNGSKCPQSLAVPGFPAFHKAA